MCINFSKHANERLGGRMAGIVTSDEIESAVNRAGQLGLGETALIVKRLKTVKAIRTSDGQESIGNVVVAVYRRSNSRDSGCVTTVELRGSWQPVSHRWSQIIDLTI